MHPNYLCQKAICMKKFVIERNFPDAGSLSAEELSEISQSSCNAIEELGKPYTWLHSYITQDKIYCIHIAESKDVIREHSRIAKFPINTISEVKSIADPSTCNPLNVA